MAERRYPTTLVYMFVGLAELKFAKGRFAAIGGVIALMTLLSVMLGALTAGLQDASISAVRAIGATGMVVSSDSGDQGFESSRLDSTIVDRLLADGGTALGLGNLRTTSHSGSAIAAVLASTEYTDVTVPPDVAHRLGVTAGDRIDIDGNELAVSSVDELGQYAHQPVITMPLTQWQSLTRTTGATAVAFRGAQPTVMPGGTTLLDGSAIFAAVPGYSSEHGSLQAMQVLILIIGAMVVGVFFVVWTIQRTRDLAVLRALGGSRRFLFIDALGQACVVLLGGLVVGGGVGLVCAALLGGAAVPISLTLAGIGSPLIATFVLGLAGAAFAVVRVARVDPLIALNR